MTKEFASAVYYTLHGNPLDYPEVPNVENLFAENKPCFKHYEAMHQAHIRLLDRLGVDEDPDIETIICALMDIEQIIAEEMFFCGVHFGLEENYRRAYPQLFPAP